MRRVASFIILLALAVPVVSGDDALPVVKAPQQVVARLQVQTDALTAKGLTELFKAPAEAVTTKSGMLVAETIPDVLVARMSAEGKVETECVATSEAAARFFAAPRVRDVARTSTEK
jgi:hypothetical protein